MKKLAFALAAPMALALALPAAPAFAWDETPQAKDIASEASAQARADMEARWPGKVLRPGEYVWDASAKVGDDARVIVSLEDQMAYLYSGGALVAATTISSGKPGKATPKGIFPILEKKTMHRSRKYDNAPMPFMQRLDSYGIALHAGVIPGRPASHGCVRLPASFAAKLFKVTDIGTEVMIGA
jgi:lipoprotein-anchoring transpeptidase ErfK/SrfK